jgi:hypothetical protein
MIPSSLNDFTIAILGASASFIGLLFVAISFTPATDKIGEEYIEKKRTLAEGSYAALINIFFIGLVGLTPEANVGYVMLVMAFFGLLTVYRFWRSNKSIKSHLYTLTISLIIYILEIIYGIYIVKNDNAFLDVNLFMTLIIVLFATALGRAWELTGIRKKRKVNGSLF